MHSREKRTSTYPVSLPGFDGALARADQLVFTSRIQAQTGVTVVVVVIRTAAIATVPVATAVVVAIITVCVALPVIVLAATGSAIVPVAVQRI